MRRIAELWDVVQSEVDSSRKASGNPMTLFNYVIPRLHENILTGKLFPADLGAFRSELYFETDKTLVFTINDERLGLKALS